jgi:hypothetical protein
MDADVSNRAEPQARAAGRKVASPNRRLFRREGEYWTVEYAGEVCRLRDGAGLRYLACLLGRPGEKVLATELTARYGRDDASSAAVAPSSAAEGERARVRVTRAIRAALTRLGEHNPALLEHLKASIRTGAHCSYVPDSRRCAEWQL